MRPRIVVVAFFPLLGALFLRFLLGFEPENLLVVFALLAVAEVGGLVPELLSPFPLHLIQCSHSVVDSPTLLAIGLFLG